MATERKVKVKTSDGKEQIYKIEEYRDRLEISYKSAIGFFSDDYDKVATSKSLEDAIVMIRAHATKFGTVKSVDFD